MQAIENAKLGGGIRSLAHVIPRPQMGSVERVMEALKVDSGMVVLMGGTRKCWRARGVHTHL